MSPPTVEAFRNSGEEILPTASVSIGYILATSGDS
jgi:hypothetical protein